MVDVINLQRKVRIDLAPIRVFVADLSQSISEAENKTFSVAFVSDNRMRQLNEMFRGKNETTDVLSFPHEPDEFVHNTNVQSASFSLSQRGTDSTQKQAEACTLNTNFLGDIVISAEQAAKQASENGLTLDAEIKQLILHGLLHLCGYDHETDNGEMNTRELTLRKKLGI